MISLQKISVSVCISVLPAWILAGDPALMPAGATQAGMGYVSVMKPGFWPSFHNQASLCHLKTPAAGINYENRFGLKELGTATAGAAFPAGRVTLAAVYSRFGYSDFYRQMAGAACALPVAERICAGIQIDYFSEKAYGEYSDSRSVTFEAGILIVTEKDLRIGIHVFNPIPDYLRRYNMVSALSAGAGGNLGTNLFAGIEAVMTTRGNIDFRGGFEYSPADKLYLRGGFRTLNSSFSFGIGFQARPAAIDIAFATHEKLGITSSVSLLFNIISRD